MMSTTKALSFSGRSTASNLATMDFNIGCNCKCPKCPTSGGITAATLTDDEFTSTTGYFRHVLAYTPKECSVGTVSCGVKSTIGKTAMTTDSNLVVIPTNAIIDYVEYYGVDNFCTKDEFNIGLGQLNQRPLVTLLESCSAEIANERSGGRRNFVSIHPDGSNDSIIVLYPSYVNVEFTAPVTRGWLAVVVGYHVKSV